MDVYLRYAAARHPCDVLRFVPEADFPGTSTLLLRFYHPDSLRLSLVMREVGAYDRKESQPLV